MRRYFALLFLVVLSIPAGVSISGCVRNPAGNYCNGLGYGLKDTDVYSIDLEPRTTGISIAFGQTRQIASPTAKTCKGASASVSKYTYGTTNNRLVDISPSGSICAGTWNRNSGGGIADYTICNPPSPTPSSDGLPYSSAYISAAADSITSNPVQVYVHAPVGSISLAISGASSAAQSCNSQGTVGQLDAEACFAKDGVQYEMCAPPGTTHYSCKGGLAPGVSSVPDCTQAIGVLTYTVGTTSVATIDSTNNTITAELPGTTAVTASVAGSGSSAGYFSTCPPKSIHIALANGATSGVITQGVQQNLTTTVLDTKDAPITGLALDYQSTNPLNITSNATGGITASFPGSATITAVCQPSTCNPAPINEVGAGTGTGLSVSSNPVELTTPGTASAFAWYSAPGKSQYFVPVELLTGTIGSTVRLPYVPNSMLMDQTGTNLYFGSSHELMIYTASANALSKVDPTVPGVVLAVAPNSQTILINDQSRQVFYIYSSSSGVTGTFGGLGTAAKWTQDSKTLYITDSASAGPGHSNTLYVYNANTGWTTYSLASSGGAQNVAITVPGVGAYLAGPTTVAHTWCPSGTVGNYQSMVFYPEADSVAAATDVLAATTDGAHILGAAASGGGITLSDIAVAIPTTQCPVSSSGALSALTLQHTLTQTALSVNATDVNQIVTSPAAVAQGSSASAYSLSFVTYDGAATGATLPYYKQVSGATTNLGTVGYLPLTGSGSITAPVAGAFSPDSTLFFVSTSGDNLIHYIDTQKALTDPTHADTQQINPNLPACAPGSDNGCVITSPINGSVPATAIAVKPRSTT